MITPMVIRQPLSPEEIDYLLGLMMEAEEPTDIDGVELYKKLVILKGESMNNMRLAFVVSLIWFLHWLCLILSSIRVIIVESISQTPSLIGSWQNILVNGTNLTSMW